MPWGGLAGREAARFLADRWRLNPAAAVAPLLAQLEHYPLDPWRWLLYSRIQWANDSDPAQLRHNLSAAISVQPHNREVRWQAANLAQSTGDNDLVLDQIARWLADEPRNTARALFIAGRWADDPGTLLDRVVPEDEAFLAEAMRYAYRSHNVALAIAVWRRLDQPRDPGDEAFADYVRTALNNDRPDLAMQAWQQVDPDYRPGDIPAGDFGVALEAMETFGWNLRMRDGVVVERVQADIAMSSRPPSRDLPPEGATSREAPDQVRGDRIEGAGHEDDPSSRPPSRDLPTESATIGEAPDQVRGDRIEGAGHEDDPSSRPPSRDLPTEGATIGEAPDQVRGDKAGENLNRPTSQPANQPTRKTHALRLSFNGEKNVHLATPEVRFPMPEPGRYRLTGLWRAEDLTTRSLPYVQLYAESSDHRFNQTVEVPGQNFEWQRFEIPFEVTEPDELFRFRLRRNRTDAFDRYIEGSLWLAGLRVEEVARTGEGVVDDS